MKLHKDSHLDHGLSWPQMAHVLLMFADRSSFFIETITLPDHLGQVPCALFGPIMGDDPIPDLLVERRERGDRKYASRVLSRFDPVGTDWIKLGTKILNTKRTVNTITVIGGPHDGEPCILYTAFGGPPTPKEPDDPTLTDDKRAESIDFWQTHALAY